MAFILTEGLLFAMPKEAQLAEYKKLMRPFQIYFIYVEMDDFLANIKQYFWSILKTIY